MEISVKLFVYCFIIGILHCPNYAQANDKDLENFLLSLDQCLLQIDEYNEEPGNIRVLEYLFVRAPRRKHSNYYGNLTDVETLCGRFADTSSGRVIA